MRKDLFTLLESRAAYPPLDSEHPTGLVVGMI